MFIQKPDGTLAYHHKLSWLKDKQLPKTTTGYSSAAPGDSGCPIWTSSTVDKEKRQTILAVMGGTSIMGSTVYSTSAKDQCRMYASKISEDVIDWIVQKFFI